MPHNTADDRADSAHSAEKSKDVDWAQWPNDAGFQSWLEQKTPVKLNVTGTIPSYGAGTLYRTGPSAYKADTKTGKTFETSHWFDGWSKVHRFQIGDDGSVTYNSRGNVDELVDNIRKTGSMHGFSFGQKRDPCESLFKKVMSTFEPLLKPSNDFSRTGADANIGVTLSVNMPGLTAPNKHASGIQTLTSKTDASSFKKLDPETLEPIGVANQATLHPSLTGPMSSAHAKSDPETGDVFNYNLAFGRQPLYRVFKTSASTGETEILATFPAKAAYIHSLFLTKDHVVLCVWNAYIKAGGISILYNHNIMDSIAPFDASIPASWYVIDRRHGKGLLATYESPAFYCFHTLNAWIEPSAMEEGKEDIVCELMAFTNLDVLHKFYYENLLSTAPGNKQYQGKKGEEARGTFRRYRLPAVPTTAPKGKLQAKMEYSAPSAASPELPTMNPNFVTKPHRYSYGIADRGLSSFADGLVKWDSKTQTASYWETFAHTPGESIFVPNPDGSEEDDGVLLSVVLDGIKESSYLLCLDARTMTELGRAEVDGVVGFGFHGVHVKAGGDKAIEM